MPCPRIPVSLFSALLSALVLLRAGPASADPQAEAQRALIERQQQSDAFALQLRQSQQMLNSGGFAQQQKQEALNLEQRQRLQNLNDQQLMQIQPSAEGTADAARRSGYQQQRLEQERQTQIQNFERQRQQLEREKSSPDARQ